MIRLHVGNNQIVRLAVAQHLHQIFHPLFRCCRIYRVHNGKLLVLNHIGIIRNTIGDGILALKQVNGLVIYTNIKNRLGIWNCL